MRRHRPLLLACAALAGGLSAFGLTAAVASASTSETFTIVNPSGIPQFSYYGVWPAGSGPAGPEWSSQLTTATPGQVTIGVAPGELVYFRRTGFYDPSGKTVPPEGDSGVVYTVPAVVPATAIITLPATGPAYEPGLTGSEEWLLGQINQRRVQAGAPALKASTTLNSAASVEARDEVINHRWPDPYFFAIPQDFGWPGDIANDYTVADAPFSDPHRVLTHWDGDPSDPESAAIWQALSDPSLTYVGIADGSGAWVILGTYACPGSSDAAACGLTTDTGNTSAWSPTQITIGAPAGGGAYTSGQSVTADYTCAALSDGVTVASCSGPVASGEPIDTATAGSHSFAVTATDVNGDTTTQSVQYDVNAAKPSNTSAPTGYGSASPTVGQQFTGTAGEWSGTQPISYAYTWLRCPDTTVAHCAVAFQSSASASTTHSYTLQQADVGDRMLLRVYAYNSAGSDSAYTASFSGVIQPRPTPPSNTSAPTGYGNVSPTVWQQFTGFAGSWSGTQPIIYAYTWLRCPDTMLSHCKVAFQSLSINGISTSYTLRQADAGDRMLLKVTASNSAGFASAYTASFSGVIESQLTVSTATPDAATTTISVPAGQPTVRAQIQYAGATQSSLCLTKGSLCFAGDSVRQLILGSYVKHHARRGPLRLKVSVSPRELRYLRHRHIHRLSQVTLVITIAPSHGGAPIVTHSAPFTIPIH